MTALNADALNRTIFISDNLPFLKSLDTACVDLVCIDPPFGKNETFSGSLRPPLSDEERRVERELMHSWGVYDPDTAYEMGLEYPDQEGATANFEDIWDFKVRVYEDWMNSLETVCPGAYLLIQSARYTHSDGVAAYIAFMVERMLEIRRVLKPNGSVYLHCDHEAKSYLRPMMDAVFGVDKYRNEIVWRRASAHNDSRRYGAVIDAILFYGTRRINRDAIRVPLDPDYVEKSYRFKDERGRYQVGDLTGAGHRTGESGRAWKGIDPGNRHWAVPSKSGYADWIEREFIPGYTSIESVLGRLDALDFAGMIHWPKRAGGIPQLKRYLAANAGQVPTNIWTDIRALGSQSGERTGYPTQKPQALARRIIEASSDPGDLVLDCFAGCAYVPVAAELTGRRWIACDMSPRAWTIVRRQFSKQRDLRIVTEGEYAAGEGVVPSLGDDRIIRVRGPNELPTRASPDDPTQTLPARPLPAPQYRRRPLESGKEIWDAFVETWGTGCWYCGTVKQPYRQELQLDHVEPNSRDGANDDCWNRALACVTCNGAKSDSSTPEQAIDRAFQDGRIATPALRDETLAGFARRRQWARERYETLKAAKAGGGEN